MSAARRTVLGVVVLFTLILLISHATTSSSRHYKIPLKDQQAVDPDSNSADHIPLSEPQLRGQPQNDASPRIPADKPLADISNLPLRKQLKYLYPYTASAKFPAYIWQTWKSTPADGHFEFREHEASWTVQHPGFVHEVIPDNVVVPLLRLLYASAPRVLEAYHALPKSVLKADFFRYLILFARGGIYTDIDTVALRGALEWIPESVPRSEVGLVVGIEADPDREDWHDWYSRRIQFCQWTIQAKPGHPVLLETIANITETTLAKKQSGALKKVANADVVEFTGPALWTDQIMDYLNDPTSYRNQKKNPPTHTEENDATTITVDWRNFTGIEAPKLVSDVLVLPITAFSPGIGHMGSKGVEDPTAMVLHEFQGTWKPESERHIGKQE